MPRRTIEYKPEYVKFSILTVLENDNEHRTGDLVDNVAKLLNISREDRDNIHNRTPGDQHDQFYQSVTAILSDWCDSQKKYVHHPRQGYWKISPAGKEFRKILRLLLR